MGQRSTSLKLRQIRRVDRLIGECLELWSDPAAWQAHLIQSTASLLGLRVGMLAEVNGFDPDCDPQMISAFEAGWESEAQQRAFLDSPTPGRPKPFSVSPVDLKFRAAFGPRRGATRTRSDLIDDHTWQRDLIYNEMHRPAAMDEVVYSALRVPHRGSTSMFAFGGNETLPGPRQRKLLALLHHQLMPLLGTRLTTYDQPGPHRLSPAQRAVYDLLLTGLSEKEICARLGRTRSTVTSHIAAIYGVFGVASRVELLSQYATRRPTGPTQ